MIKLIAATALILAHASSAASAQTLSISRNGFHPSQKGPADHFTGSVRIDPLFDPQGPAGAGSAWVMFEPGARTAWHNVISLPGADARNAVAQQAVRADSYERVRTMKIRMDLEGTVITATLDNNATSRDFVSLLPLTLTLQDYAATEKIADPPRKLSTAGAPPGSDPSVGDIAYYAPWGNLALYYRDFGYSSGLIKLGTMDSGVERLRQPGPLKVTIERVEEQS